MIRYASQSRYLRALSGLAGWIGAWLIPTLLRRRSFGVVFAASLLAVVYWGLIASDRYTSEAHVIIQTSSLAGAQPMDIGSLLGGLGSSGSKADQLYLRDYLLSVDMLKKLDARLNLRAHYSDWHRDPLSRMWFANSPLELFHNYYLARVSVELDEYAGVLVIKAQGYDPRTAHAITAMMLEEGERFMNTMAQRMAEEQVLFLEKQVAKDKERTMQSRQLVLDFQNRKGLVSPQATAESIAGVVNSLEAQRSGLQTRRSAMLGYLMPNNPAIVDLDMQLAAIDKQITQEQARLVSPNGKMLNSTVEEFQRLQANADFYQEVYKSALIALETGRVEAARNLKKVSVLLSPTQPEYPLEPRRMYNTLVFILATLLLAGIVHLLAAIIRDHKD
jgi:capsular polysaccharide transport system permease protein